MISYYDLDETCPTCGCTIGAGCPQSTTEEKEAYRNRHPEDFDPEEFAESIIKHQDKQDDESFGDLYK